MVHVRELSLHKPVLSSGILMLCYQIDQCCKEGKNKVCFSGCLDLFSLSRISFMKMPVQAITQKYNKNKVEIITAYILALSKNQNKIIFQMELKNPWPSNVYPKNKALWMPALGNKLLVEDKWGHVLDMSFRKQFSHFRWLHHTNTADSKTEQNIQIWLRT